VTERRIHRDGRRFASRERRDAAAAGTLPATQPSLSLSLSHRSRPACDISISIERNRRRRITWYERVFYEFFTVASRVLSVSPSGAPIVRRRICMINHRASRAGIGRSVKRTMTDASVTNLVAQNASSASKLCISGTEPRFRSRFRARARVGYLKLHCGHVRAIQSDEK
jgi:hypothetical protein